jgi:hypothetical protein
MSEVKQRLVQPYLYGKFSEDTFSPEKKITLVAWNSSEGKNRLITSQFNESFFTLANFFQPQINPVYCGVASAVIVLNALSQRKNSAPIHEYGALEIPTTKEVLNLPAFFQHTFLNEKTNSIKEKSVVEFQSPDASGNFRPGLSLKELKDLIESHQAKVTITYPSEENQVNEFRKVLKSVCAKEDEFLICHFRSNLMGGIPAGHISPLAAFHEPTDSVLILDVAGHKGPWYWAPVTSLYQAMAFPYDTQPKGGGYLVVSAL